MDPELMEWTGVNNYNGQDDLNSLLKKRSGNEGGMDDETMLPLRKRLPNHIYREKCQALPKNWIREVSIRKNGLMANTCDVRYISPSGERFDRMAQLVRKLKDTWDLDGFNFKTGKVNEILKRWIKLKPQFFPELPPFESICDPELDPPIRQTASIFKQPVSLVKPTSSPVKLESNEGPRDKPKQIFWHKRLEGLQTENTAMELPNKIHLLYPPLASFKSEAIDSAYRSIATSLHMKTGPIIGQHLDGDEAENLDPTICINPDQPLIHSVAVYDEDIQTQEIKLREARSRLADALSRENTSS